MKKIKVSSELMYILGIVIMSFSVAMVTTTNFGLSMIVAPAYIISQKIGITFGQGEYLVQGVMFILFCICMKRFRFMYFGAFITGALYGTCLDIWSMLVPHFNSSLHAPGTLPLGLRVVYFVCATCMTSLGVAMFFKTYLYPQVYDFFVKGIAERYELNRTKFKIGYDVTSLAISVVLSLVLFKGFVGIGVGTIITTIVNGALIGFFDRFLSNHFIIEPKSSKLEKIFRL